jgi:hypothetical protein
MTNRDHEMEWRDLGYPEKMGSAKFLPPPDRNFVRVYHLTSAEHGISSISLGRLKVARIREVNDPFELMPLNSHEREIRRLLLRFKDSQNSKIGLLCFSQNWTNPILWSHYADKHKGICLGFDLRREQIQKIYYVKERSRMVGTSITTDIENLLLRTKFEGWEYEQEIRRVVDLSITEQENDLYFLPFDGDLLLKEVILGVRNQFSLEVIRKLKEATNPAAVVFKTRLEYEGFRIVGDGNDPPA